MRFRGTLYRLATELAPRWSEVALACGYYDHAHLIREVRRFAGVTPVQLWRWIQGLHTGPWPDVAAVEGSAQGRRRGQVELFGAIVAEAAPDSGLAGV